MKSDTNIRVREVPADLSAAPPATHAEDNRVPVVANVIDAAVFGSAKTGLEAEAAAGIAECDRINGAKRSAIYF